MATTVEPALQPPLGIVPDFDHPKKHQLTTSIIVFTIGLLSAVSLMSSLLMARRLIAKRLFLDDYVLLGGFLLYVVVATIALVNFQYGLGAYQWDLTFTQAVTILRLEYCVQIVYTITILILKITILLQLKRIFAPQSNTKSYWVSTFLIWFTVMFAITSFSLKLFGCQPIQKNWNYHLSGHCINKMAPNMITAIVNVITDVVILTLLVLWARGTNMSRRRKWQIAVLFALGSFSCLSCIIRCVVISAKIRPWSDTTYKLADVNLWMFIHLTVTIQCATLPSLPGLLKIANKRLYSKVISLSSHPTSGSSGGHASVVVSKPRETATVLEEEKYIMTHDSDIETNSLQRYEQSSNSELVN